MIAAPRIIPTASDTLSAKGIGYMDGRRIVFWDVSSRKRIATARIALVAHLGPLLSKLCTHAKCHGGVKGTIRALQSEIKHFTFVARFDVASYYDSINHAILLNQVAQANAPTEVLDVVRQYLEVPDAGRTGAGLTAGGSLSSLLGALYLQPFDMAFERLMADGRIFYRRYMDDIVILAETRNRLRAAIRTVHRTLAPLMLRLHDKQKRYIGRTAKGFDFLGYRLHPKRLLRPSSESVHRMKERDRRLYEQGASMTRLRRYVSKWWSWLRGGLAGLVFRKGGMRRYWVRLLAHLDIHDPGVHPPVHSGR